MDPRPEPGTPLADGPNYEQVRYWNEEAGERWVAHIDDLDIMVGSFGEAGLEAAALETGDRVLDVGCGCGSHTLGAARLVGEAGEVLGVDISSPMLAAARRRCAAAGASNTRFQSADAQTHRFGAGHFDAVISRFGVMFFADPQAAFTNLVVALRPGGRVAFVVWQEVARNPWLLVPVMAVREHLALPSPPPEGGPGPFSLHDADRLDTLLSGAGLEDVSVESLERPLRVPAAGVDDAAEFVLRMGPLGDALSAADEPTRAAAAAAVATALVAFRTDRGVEMPGAAWLATGWRPAG